MSGSQRARRFLYITPYFPPQTRVGALRPLKFVRHLRSAGWLPVVLADLRAGDAQDPALLQMVPPEIPVAYDYASATIHPTGGSETGEAAPSRGAVTPPVRTAGLRRRLAAFDDYASRQPWYPGPEWLPLGRHSLDIRHALAAARRTLERHPGCEAIMVNADPYAALLVGARLAVETGLPLISDLRDPWAPCELRRGQRPPPQRWLVDRLERRVVEASAKVMLNSEGALAAYRDHYADLSPERFVCLRNHADRDLIRGGSWQPPPADRVRLLFLGNLRRFVQGEQVLQALRRLRPPGVGRLPVELVVSGQVTPEARRLADSLGVTSMLHAHPFVPQSEIGGFMHGAHALILLHHSGGSYPAVQRIPAKLYEYLASDRPIIAAVDNPEVRRLLSEMQGTTCVGPHDVDGLAEVFERLRVEPPSAPVERELGELSSEGASRRLAELLAEVAR